MNKLSWRHSWPRFLLWLHVLGVIGFYLMLWLRTMPKKEDRVESLPPQDSAMRPHANPFVSIVVPARNEARNIRRCVQSLLEQDYDNYELIVVDDGSTDETGRILDELAASSVQRDRLWILRLCDLPDGWAGKPHALYRGLQEAQGAWFLLTDADTWHAPNALRSSITQALREEADLFTLGTTQELPTFWERVLMPMAYLGISMQYPPNLVNDPASPVAIANGQYLLIRRKVYELLGGYARPDLRSTLLDDRDLARIVKTSGFKLRFVDGRNLVHVRMYQGFGEAWRGWHKNAFLGSRGGIIFTLLQLLGLPNVSVIPFLLPILAIFMKKKHENKISAMEATIAAIGELVPLCLYRTWLNRQMNIPWYYVLTHPLAGIVFEGILGQSTWRIITGKGVDWRGRAYHTTKRIGGP